MPQQVIFTNEVDQAIDQAINSHGRGKVAVIVDHNTRRHVLPQLQVLNEALVIEIPCGDEHKSLDTLSLVWTQLSNASITRGSVIVNLGGGVITDLGGLAASTFKRGVPFINVPTTLLGAVDAAVGGKTGINFNGLKNEIGCFAEASHVIVSTRFFDTLPRREVMSGYAEMLKHALLTGEAHFGSLLHFDPTCANGNNDLLQLLKQSVQVKMHIVAIDPHEKGPRRALNLGHTVGHAFESMAMHAGHAMPHGYAVAWGLVAEMVLSHMLLQFPSQQLHNLATYVLAHYQHPFSFTCDDYNALLMLMRHDKKSQHGEINCTLLGSCGNYVIDNTIKDDDMKTALDIFRDLMHM